jgi:predicted glycosyltransferase
MRLLFDISHPVQVHLFRPVIEACRAAGHEVRVIARDKDVTLPLLRHFGIEAEVLAPTGRGLFGFVRELVVREARMASRARRFRPDLIVGTSAHAARVARVSGARSVVMSDDDADAVPVFRWLAYPLATVIVTPSCLRHEDHGRRHRVYDGYQQLFYLHPNRFRPDPSVRRDLGLADGERFGLLRLSALAAHHDRGVRGLSGDAVQGVRDRVAGRFRLFVSSEKPLPESLEPLRVRVPPHRLHDVLAAAAFFVGDSQSMTAESAVLGVPAFRLNDFVGRISYLRELEEYGLAFGFRLGEEGALLDALERTLAEPDRPAVFAARRARMLEQKGDPLPWLLALLAELSGARAA